MNSAPPDRLEAFSEWTDRHFKWLLVVPAVFPVSFQLRK